MTRAALAEGGMHLKTRLTEKLGIEHPIVLASMNVLAGGKLAAEVSVAGGLGVIGGGYGVPECLKHRPTGRLR